MAEFNNKVDVNTEIANYNKSLIKKNLNTIPKVEQELATDKLDNTDINRTIAEFQNINEKLTPIEQDEISSEKELLSDVNTDVSFEEKEAFQKSFGNENRTNSDETNESIESNKISTREDFNNIIDIPDKENFAREYSENEKIAFEQKNDDLNREKDLKQELLFHGENNDLRITQFENIISPSALSIEAINNRLNELSNLDGPDAAREAALLRLIVSQLRDNPLEESKLTNTIELTGEEVDLLNNTELGSIISSNEYQTLPIGNSFAGFVEPTKRSNEETVKNGELDTYFQIFNNSVIPYGVNSLLSTINQGAGAIQSIAENGIGGGVVKSTLLGLSLLKNASLVESFFESHTSAELTLYFAFNLLTSFLVERDDLSSIKDRSKERGEGGFVFDGKEINLEFSPRNFNFNLSSVNNFFSNLVGFNNELTNITGNNELESKKLNSEQPAPFQRNEYDENGIRSGERTGDVTGIVTKNFVYSTQSSGSQLILERAVFEKGSAEGFSETKENTSPNQNQFNPNQIIKFNSYNFANRNMQELTPNQLSDRLEEKFGDLLNSNKIGFLHAKPKDDSIGDDIYSQFRIPFQFNPIINEGSIEAKYATTSILNRIGDLYNFTGTGQFTFSLETEYYVLSDGTAQNRGNSFITNGSHDGMMQEATLENIQVIEGAWRSLVLPLQESQQQNLFIPPPVIRIIIGGPRGDSGNNEADTQDEKLEYSNILTYPSLSNPRRRRLRVFICTGVTIQKNFQETPFVFKEGRIDDLMGFSVQASFVEVDPSYNETLADYKNYRPLVNGLLGSGSVDGARNPIGSA